MDERYSYLIELETRSGETEKIYYENESDAEEAFREYADENDEDVGAKYAVAQLKKVDWYGRAEYELKSTNYE